MTDTNISFRFFETSKSAVKLTKPLDFFDRTSIPVDGGVYDLRMGAVLGFPCSICKGSKDICPGHWGVVELHTPVVWPHQANILVQMLNSCCIWDRNLKLFPRERVLARLSLELLEHHCISEAEELWNNPIRFAVSGNNQMTEEETTYIRELFTPWFSQTKKHANKEKKENKQKKSTKKSNKDMMNDSEDSENTSSSSNSDSESENESRSSSSNSDNESEVHSKSSRKQSEDSGSEDSESQSDSDNSEDGDDELIEEIGKKKANSTTYLDINPEQEKILVEKVLKIIESKAAQAKITIQELKEKCFNLPTAAFQASRLSLIKEIFAILRMRSSCPDDGGSILLPKFRLDVENGTKVIFMPKGLTKTSHLSMHKKVYFFEEKKDDSVVYTNEIFNFLKEVYKNDSQVLSLIFRVKDEESFARIFMAKEFNVAPNNTRPPEKGMVSPFKSDTYSTYIKKMISANNHIETLKEKDEAEPSSENEKNLKESSLALQNIFTELIEGSKLGKWKGIKEEIGRKEGIFRKYFMGKRVNFSGRSVITPSLTCDAGELQIPQVVASKLSYPVSVTEFNCKELMKYIRNGSKYPGAVSVELFNGKIVRLYDMPLENREALASQLLTHVKTVNRHIINGDYCLFNRQPTLHRPSLLAQKVRVSPLKDEKVFRFHYANCKSFNADFDGDEMNVHFPRNEVSKAEMMYLAHSPLQYIDPTRGEPIRGLIQDHIVAGVLLSMKDTFLDREHYYQLIHEALYRFIPSDISIKELQPCILKPTPLWSGKQVFSTIIINLEIAFKCKFHINYEGKAKLKGSMWKPFDEEGDVIIRDGELLVGIMDKNQIGASKKSIIHAGYELHGPYFTDAFISALSRFLSLYLRNHGFTCSIEDCLLNSKGDAIRNEILKNNDRKSIADSTSFIADGEISIQDQFSLLEKAYKDPSVVKDFDNVVKKVVNKNTQLLTNKTVPDEQYRLFPYNFLSLMAESGAKGSRVNVSQISCCLGLQTYGGLRVTPTISGQTLPSFDSFDLRPIAGGYIGGRFLTGLQPQEFFFHCMAGRDGLNDTALKTADSGYLQRCIIKAMEDVTIAYDHTVRDGHGMVIQFAYGGDGSDTSKLSFEDLKFYALNSDAVLDKYVRELGLSKQNYGDAKALALEANSYVSKQLNNEDRIELKDGFKQHWDSIVEEYISSDSDNVLSIEAGSKDRLGCKPETLKYLKQLQITNGIAAPGEAVGIIAAQAFGEPSTQMTLNTFHSTGSDVVGVTQGIPRLRQILMGGSVKENVMTFPLQKDTPIETGYQLEVIFNPINFKRILKSQTMIERFSGSNVLVTLDFIFDVEVLEKDFFFELSSFQERLMVLIEEICIGAQGIEGSKKRSLQKQLSSLEEVDMLRIVRKCLTHSGFSSVAHDWDEEDTLITSDQVRSLDKQYFDRLFLDPNDAYNALRDRSNAVSRNQSLLAERENIIKAWRNNRTSFMRLLNEDPIIDIKQGKLNFTLKVPLSEKRALSQVVTKALENTFIRYVPNIKKAQFVEDLKSILIQGKCLDLVPQFRLENVLNENGLKMNNINEILSKYGIEAGRQLIFDELDLVFTSYGQDVNKRHVSLISDWVTYLGEYQTMSKYGYKYHPSTFSRVTFEIATNVLTEAATYGFIDPIRTPSSQLILGKLTSSGTGSFDIGMDIEAINSFARDKHSIVL